ncbi:MAG: hypothetical protein NTX50_20185 [Candidatus Sumerlaeota bacterium]|nr:hypothetical protein [Candidatus Sumerlaeota bacterium]
MQGETETTKVAMEAYHRIGDPEDHFDIEYWQSQGPCAIFQAAIELVMDAELIKTGHVIEPKLQRNIERYQPLPKG